MSTFARTVRGTGGPGVALAHGAGGGVEPNYGPILDGLAEGRTVVGVDYPGAGATPRSDVPLTLDQLADELVGAAVDEGLDTFSIVGYSLGGPVAVRAASRHPDRVKALVLTATFARPDNHLRLAGDLWSRLLEAEDRTPLGDFVTLFALSPSALAALPEDDLAETVAATVATVPPGTPEQVDLVRHVDIRAELAELTIPTLVITTTADLLVPPPVQRDVAARIPGARVAELDTGHLPFAERPDEWLKLITTFLEEVAA
ncbi:alpha/beta hydrolase [Actinomadura sp. NPDC047616]|uniref:alpha/beta fold hydrolase n=1 Tax=Actinomadura sp. NPDC047616 TaxID=3155914 RepID=UPI0033D3C142